MVAVAPVEIAAEVALDFPVAADAATAVEPVVIRAAEPAVVAIVVWDSVIAVDGAPRRERIVARPTVKQDVADIRFLGDITAGIWDADNKIAKPIHVRRNAIAVPYLADKVVAVTVVAAAAGCSRDWDMETMNVVAKMIARSVRAEFMALV